MFFGHEKKIGIFSCQTLVKFLFEIFKSKGSD